MRYSILGFNQRELIKYNVDMTDVLLMDYIQKALSQPSMVKIDVDGQPYVWLSHAKILEDLPILNIKESMLKKRMANLIEIGLIKSIVKTSTVGRGSRSYYSITEQFEQLQNDDMTEGNKLSLVERPSVKNYPSDNKLINNKNISKDILQDVVTSEQNLTKLNNKLKSKGKNLYQKCLDLINDFTDNEELRHSLTECFKLFSENSRDAGMPFYANNFKGKLNTLAKLSTDTEMQIKIVQQTLDSGWQNFYAIKGDIKRKSSRYTTNEPTDMGYVVDRANRRGDIRGEKF